MRRARLGRTRAGLLAVALDAGHVQAQTPTSVELVSNIELALQGTRREHANAATAPDYGLGLRMAARW